jgi:hypothetical protein
MGVVKAKVIRGSPCPLLLGLYTRAGVSRNVIQVFGYIWIAKSAG